MEWPPYDLVLLNTYVTKLSHLNDCFQEASTYDAGVVLCTRCCRMVFVRSHTFDLIVAKLNCRCRHSKKLSERK